jgi:hypothetical protein
MRNLNNFPGGPPNWTNKDGTPFDPANLKPAIDTTGNVYGMKPDGSVVVVETYESYRVRSARDFAVWVWNDKKDWPSADEKIVQCLGAACCNIVPAVTLSSEWRLTDISNGQLLARQTIGSEDPADRLEDGEEHLLYISGLPKDIEPNRSRHHDIMAAAIQRFGAPFNAITGEINPPFSSIYRSQSK